MLKPKSWECYKLEGLSEFLKLHIRPQEESFLLVPFLAKSPSCPGVNCDVESLSRRVVKANASRFIFVARDDAELEEISRETSGTAVEIVRGNITDQKTLRAIFDPLPRSSSGLALINPKGYKKLRWSTMRKLSCYGSNWEGYKMELVIFLPVDMALLRNLTREDCQSSLDRFFGRLEWREIREKRAGGLDFEKTRDALVNFYLDNLKLLGYNFVETYRPLARAPYQVFWASDRHNELRNIQAAWGKPRYLPCELFYG